MRGTKYHLGLLASSMLGMLVLAVSPVAAQHGAADTSGSTSDSTSTSTDATETETHTSLRDQAKQMLAEKRQNIKEHTADQKKKACEAHSAEINKRSKNYATAAQRHLDVFNSIFSKVKAFHDSKQLNVTNYDALVAAATAKQTAAQAAVDTLKGLDVSIDCTATDPASTVATLKTAVKNARTSLQDYRQSIKDLVVALKGASTTQTSTTTGGDQ